jgi:hypothetical protein
MKRRLSPTLKNDIKRDLFLAAVSGHDLGRGRNGLQMQARRRSSGWCRVAVGTAQVALIVQIKGQAFRKEGVLTPALGLR